jgi:hypothetical protein
MKKSAAQPVSPKKAKPEFVRRAEKSMLRVARKLRAEHRRLNLPLLVFGDGK